MGIIVGIAIVAVLALIVAATAGGDQIDSMNPYYGMDEEQLAELREGGRRHEECSGPVVSDSNYFDRLMTPGSDEDAWHNAALDEGYDPENW